MTKGRLLKWTIALVLVVGAGFGIRAWLHKGRPHIVYRHATVSRSTIRVTILSTGTVAPENRLDLKPPVAGRVEKVLVQEGDKVRQGQILAWMSPTERATLIDTARSQGKAELAYWEEAYKMTPILAPSRGLIILKNADSGQTVTQTDIVLSMSDRLIVKVNVDETDLAQIKNEQKVFIVLDAFANRPLPGKVHHIGYDAKTVNNVTTYEVDVATDETPDFMKSGMTANATFLVAEKNEVLVVPAAAIHHEDKRSFLLVPNPEVKEDSIEKDVEIGLTDGKKVEVVSGVAEGDTILLASLASFGTGDKAVNPFSSMNGGNRGGQTPARR